MNAVGTMHLGTMLLNAAIVAVIYTINLSGERAKEPVGTGIVRRFLKIVGALLYGAIITAILTYGARHDGFARLVASASVLLMLMPPIFLLLPESIQLLVLVKVFRRPLPESTERASDEGDRAA